MTRGRVWSWAAAGVGVLLVPVLASAANWRLALVAALTAAAIALTRLRYSPLTAVGLLAIVVVLAATGHTAGSDARDAPARSSASHSVR
jgi:hypothetical protein